jgi:ABC-2 type transport system ATP-binding protein
VFSRLYRIPRKERKERMERALSFMGLDQAAHKLVREFSGGMIRRLEIAQSMLHRPAVLFLDEPTIGLDPAARRMVWDDLHRLVAQEGATLVLTTHDMEEAEELCDDIVIMRRGRIVAEGTSASLKAAVGPDATLDDAFIAFSAEPAEEESEGGFRDVARTRRTARRLG